MNTSPNIDFIITDQQRLDTIRPLGAEHADTPNLDRLVQCGTAFEGMYVTVPSCAPSHASLFSGTWPHVNGVFRNNEPWAYSWVSLVAERGYRTVSIGKMHTVPFEGAFGYHQRHAVENKDRDTGTTSFFIDAHDKAFFARGLQKPSRMGQSVKPGFENKLAASTWQPPEDLHPDIFVGNLAAWWIDRYPGQELFFLQVGFPGPHPPCDPTARHLARMDGLKMPPAIPSDIAVQPRALRELQQSHLGRPHDGVRHLTQPTAEKIDRQSRHYHANVSLIDEQIGHILDALCDRGVLENTVIIFTSDHGDMLTDHGHSEKWTMYEGAVRVPAILSWPGHLAEGQRTDGLVLLFDLGPMVLELAGIEPPSWMQAQSLIPLVRGKAGGRARVFAKHANDGLLRGTKMMTMVREGHHKLVHLVDDDFGELFNLEAEPDEQINLWDESAHRAFRDRLIGKFLEWRTLRPLESQGFTEACCCAALQMALPKVVQASGQFQEGSHTRLHRESLRL